MLRSTRLMTIALAFVFPLTVISAQQPNLSEKSREFLAKHKHASSTPAHKPELLVKSGSFTDAEIKAKIQSAAEKITQKKLESKTASNNTLVITAQNSYQGNMQFYIGTGNAMSWFPGENNLELGADGIAQINVHAKANTLYAVVIDYESYSATFLAVGPEAYIGKGSANGGLQVAKFSPNSKGQMIYFFDVTADGFYDMNLLSDGDWGFIQAKLIATPLN